MNDSINIANQGTIISQRNLWNNQTNANQEY